MTPRAVSHAAAAARTSLALLAGVGLVALGACEQRPEPHPTYTQAPPPPPAPLAGEPDAAPSMAPAPPTPSEPAPPQSAAPSQGLVAMAPIPNPDDGVPAPPSHAARRTHAVGPASSPDARPHHHRRSVHHASAPTAAPAHAARPAAPAHPAHPAPPAHAVHPAAPAVKAAAHPAAKPAPVVVPAKPAAAPAASATHEHRATRHELAKANSTSNTTGNGTAETADARTEALRSDLSAALAKGAVLSVPKATPEGASDVTLTVPADFYDTLQEQAGQHAMTDAAASVNLDATLSGDGWSIIPAGAQSLPLHAGMPTLFKWTVTAVKSATGADAGPLRADVNADLLGGGSKTLALGAISQQSAGAGGFHWWGAVLLAIVVLLGLGFLLRGTGRGGTPTNPRRRPQAAEVRRPFDMTNGNGDYRP